MDIGFADFIKKALALGFTRSRTTTITVASQANIVPSTDTTVAFNTVLIDESGAADIVNGIINIPAIASHISLEAILRWTQGATTTGNIRRIQIEVDDGSDTWGAIFPGAVDELSNYPNPGTGHAGSPTNRIRVNKVSLSAITAYIGFSPTKLRLRCFHDAGANLSTKTIGTPAASYGAAMSATFHY